MIFQTLNLKKKKNSLRKKSFREKKRRQAARIKSVREISIELFVIFQLVWILDNRSIDIIELCVELKRRGALSSQIDDLPLRESRFANPINCTGYRHKTPPIIGSYYKSVQKLPS